MGAWLNLLLAGTTSNTDTTSKKTVQASSGQFFVNGLLTVIQYVMLAACAGLALYGVYIFFAMATATDEGKRRAAKGRIIKIFSSTLIIITLYIILQGFKLTFGGFTYEEGGDGDPNWSTSPYATLNLVNGSRLAVTAVQQDGKYVKEDGGFYTVKYSFQVYNSANIMGISKANVSIKKKDGTSQGSDGWVVASIEKLNLTGPSGSIVNMLNIRTSSESGGIILMQACTIENTNKDKPEPLEIVAWKENNDFFVTLNATCKIQKGGEVDTCVASTKIFIKDETPAGATGLSKWVKFTKAN